MKKEIYSEDHQYLVRQLKIARKVAGLDQKEAARLLGRTQSYISKAESGQRKIGIVQLKRFAKIYKQNLDFFIK